MDYNVEHFVLAYPVGLPKTGSLCATGVVCYWFFFKCVDWFEKI